MGWGRLRRPGWRGKRAQEQDEGEPPERREERPRPEGQHRRQEQQRRHRHLHRQGRREVRPRRPRVPLAEEVRAVAADVVLHLLKQRLAGVREDRQVLAQRQHHRLFCVDDVSEGSIFGLKERRRSNHRDLLAHCAYFERNVQTNLLVYLKHRACKDDLSEA